jgi:hemolysin D
MVDGKPRHLTAGMTTTIEIKTGRRRLIEYVFSPITEAVGSSAHER